MASPEVTPQVNVLLTADQHEEMIMRAVETIRSPEFHQAYVESYIRRAQGKLELAENIARSPKRKFGTEEDRNRQLIIAAQDVVRASSVAASLMADIADELSGGADFDEPYTLETVPLMDSMVDCSALWTRCFSEYRGDIGPEGLGDNAGMEHVLVNLIRSSKRARLEEDSPFGTSRPDLEYYERLSIDLHVKLCEYQDQDFVRTVILEDRTGNRRYMLLDRRNGLIIGFKHAEEEDPRIATFTSKVKPQYIDKRIKECREGNDNALFDRLIGPARLVLDEDTEG